jgi:hypothetical protein
MTRKVQGSGTFRVQLQKLKLLDTGKKYYRER